MRRYIYILLSGIMGISLMACDDFLEPEGDNRLDDEYLKSNPAAAEGILLKAYVDLPDVNNFNLEAATDDAVTNNFNLSEWEMTNGQWSSQSNPVSNWKSYGDIFYINSFLKMKDEVLWDFDSPRTHELHLKRLTGEAYGLRAWYQFLLLKSHSGPNAKGEMLGFPIITTPIGVDDEWRVPRSSFDDCVAQIISDCDMAIENLPDNYVDAANDVEFNETMGSRWTNRFTANAAKALKSRVLLYAASPAYNIGNDPVKWERAATISGNFIKENGGLGVLSENLKFWIYPTGGPADADVIWGSSISKSNSLESKYFPPSLYGNAEVHPTQELVDAFPMANGYPITSSSSGYNPNYPYKGRDPRLEHFIICDSTSLGQKGIIRTYSGAFADGLNQQTNSTRTGYYVKKFLLDNVTLYPTANTANHFYTYARFTEVLLNFAEAANEAWGPDNGGDIGITARQVLGAIRKRAGINQPDQYLASLTSREEMRSLIRNERRIELCFEGQRFYDIRRWNEKEVMKASVSGVKVEYGNQRSYEYFIVEPRNYADHMIYGPIPYSETLKYDELEQNLGW